VIEIRRLGPDDWATFRAIRLAALADAPTAFGSTLAEEQLLGEPDWRDKLAGRAQFIACDTSGVLGTAGGCVEGGHMDLVSMWVDARARGRSVGAALVARVMAHARELGCPSIKLRVTVGNAPAERLYARFGFVRTGVVEPLRIDESLLEAEMELVL
jgi:GNAT superfamily N-acetyltransferase